METIADAFEALGESRATLLDALDDLDEDIRDDERWYGDWTTKDVVCHIAAWEEAFALALEDAAGDGLFTRPAVHSDDEPFNERNAHAHRFIDWEDAEEFLDDARQLLTGAMLDCITLAPEAQAVLARELAHEARHEAEHVRAIEAWRKERGL
ncbi:MAG: hypothetical protein EXR66_08115 [Dehalococcoidia bacterium]|nr:hypothetical protein [Dehalococcoidia bacterium]